MKLPFVNGYFNETSIKLKIILNVTESFPSYVVFCIHCLDIKLKHVRLSLSLSKPHCKFKQRRQAFFVGKYKFKV